MSASYEMSKTETAQWASGNEAARALIRNHARRKAWTYQWRQYSIVTNEGFPVEVIDTRATGPNHG